MELPELSLSKAVIIAFLSIIASIVVFLLGMGLAAVDAFGNVMGASGGFIESILGTESVSVLVGLGIYGMVFCWIVGIGAILYSLFQKVWNMGERRRMQVDKQVKENARAKTLAETKK